jgi:hypothetical protein
VQPHTHATKQGDATQSEAKTKNPNPCMGRKPGLHHLSRGLGKTADRGPASGSRRDIRARPTQGRGGVDNRPSSDTAPTCRDKVVARSPQQGKAGAGDAWMIDGKARQLETNWAQPQTHPTKPRNAKQSQNKSAKPTQGVQSIDNR